MNPSACILTRSREGDVGRRTPQRLVRGTVAAVVAALTVPLIALVAPAPAAEAATTAPAECATVLPGAVLPDRAVCGLLTVPENRSNPATRTIDLPYAVLPASAAATGTPLVTMSGGPGASDLDTALALADDPRIGGGRDIVYLAQRGGVDSSAPLDCPAASSAYVDTFTTDDSPADEMTEVTLALQECVAAFAADGGDITAYSKMDAVFDLMDLRQVLAYPTWTLYGQGWSTKVMQVAAARDAAGVDAVVLDAFSPIDRDVKGDAYLAVQATLAALSERSGGAYPDLIGDLATAAALFSDDPVHGLLTNPITGAQRYYSLTGSDVVTIVQQSLNDPGRAAAVPYLLSRLAAGERDAINPFIGPALDSITSTSLGQYWIGLCRDEQPYWSADPTVPAEEGAEDTEPTPLPVLTYLTAADEVCAGIGLPAATAETRAVAPVGQPTLIIASDTDPLISVDSAVSGQPAFPSSQILTVQGNGRAGAPADACALDQLAAWLAAPGTPVQSPCTDAVAAFPQITADDVQSTSRAASVVAAVEQRNLFELTIPLIFAAFAALWLVGWLIASLVQILRREPFVLLLISGIAPVTGIAFLGLCWLVITGAMVDYPAIALVGVPPVVPWLGILLGVGFLGLIPVWRLGGRGAAALAASATLVWLAMIIWFVWIFVLPS